MPKKEVFDLSTRNVQCLKTTGLWPAFSYIFRDETDETKQKKINEATPEFFDIVLGELIKTREAITSGEIKL